MSAWDALRQTIETQLQSQIVSGGLVLGLAGVLIAALRKLPGMLWGHLKRVFIVTAVIDSRSDLFHACVGWLNDLPYGRHSRLFTVIQDHRDNDTDDDPEGLPRLLYSPAPGFHLFWHGGRPMWIQRDITVNLQVIETLRISALFARRRLLEGILEEIIRKAHAHVADHTRLYTADKWGEAWNLADSRPRRRIDSVVLDGDLRERLLADIDEFFARRQWYAELGIPWRRGYLLHGPPGTGKTSLAYALAGELHLKLCALSLTNPKLNDQTIAELLQKTPPRAMILIEDIDAFFAARDKQDQRIEVSFSGLLNALDGVAAQEGRIVILTTNHIERLDPALIRPGRIDLALEIGNAGSDQLRTLFLRFHPSEQVLAEQLVASCPPGRLSPARIQQVLLEVDEPAAAAARIRQLAAATDAP